MKTMKFDIAGTTKEVEINIDELKKDKKLWKAIQDKRTIWVDNYKENKNGDAVFEFKILYKKS